MLAPQVQDDVLQREVDARGDEAGRQHERHDLQLERARVPRVRVHQDPADVAGHFEEGADDERGGEGPGAEAQAEVDLRDAAEAEDHGEEDVAAEVGVVAVGGGGDGAEGRDGGADLVAHCGEANVGSEGVEGNREGCDGLKLYRIKGEDIAMQSSQTRNITDTRKKAHPGRGHTNPYNSVYLEGRAKDNRSKDSRRKKMTADEATKRREKKREHVSSPCRPEHRQPDPTVPEPTAIKLSALLLSNQSVCVLAFA